MFLLIVSLAFNIYLLGPETISERLEMQGDQVSLQETNEDLRRQLEECNQSLEACSLQLEFYREQLLESGIGGEECPLAFLGNATMQAPAIVQRVELIERGPFIRQRVTEEGAMLDISVEMVPGRGRVLVQTVPLMGVIFQDTANMAVSLAQERTGADLSQSDIIFSITANEEIPGVDGPSAGALMTVLVLSSINSTPLNPLVTVTGTIDEQGNVGAVGGILEKAEISEQTGKELILIPEENRQLEITSETGRSVGGIVISEGESEIVDAESYIEEEIGIEVEYVSDLDDILQYVFVDQ
ncbi:S16 family serine protease [Methanolobus chelungpuianus]|uniref:S16 family serine protease n=1 Tax=Methanolobus chelungpuianus TaxID=502115 RepID=UPI002114FFD5